MSAEPEQVAPLAPEQAAPAVAEALAGLPPLRVFGVVAQAQSAFRPWLGLGGALLGSLELDPVLRELTIILVAARCGAEYELVQHRPVARQLGVGEEALDAVVAARLDDADLKARDRLALGFVEQVLLDSHAARGELGPLRAELGDRGVVELLLLTGFYRGLCDLTNAAGVEAEPSAGGDVVRGAARGSS